jgi:hypothetical protein
MTPRAAAVRGGPRQVVREGRRCGLAVTIPGLAVTILAIAATPAAAQITASEAASVTQTIDGTTLVIEYARPSLRGRDLRDDLLGGQIRWGRAWTPGANHATTLESNKDFTVSGHAVTAGRYSVWMVVDPQEWTVVLDPRDDLYHTQHPDSTDEQIRFPVLPGSAPSSVESLSWSFPAVRSTGADLRMQWGDLTIDLTVEVEPTVRLTMTPEEAAPYVGVWDVEKDESPYYGPAHHFELELRLEGDLIVGDMQFGPDFSTEMAFVEAAEQILQLAQTMNGEIVSVDTEGYLEFEVDASGTGTAFTLRGSNDDVVMRDIRIR